MIRTIFFDYDGVLTTDKSGSATTFGYLSETTGIALPTIAAAFDPHQVDLLMGRTSYARIWRQACEVIGKPLDIGLLAGAFGSTPTNQAMFSLAKRLRGNVSVGIITDNNKERMDYLRERQGLDSLFDPIVVSAEVGDGKRNPAIFLQALDRAGAKPDECIFIDNSEGNLVTARALGMHVIFHDDERNDMEALMAALESLGAGVDHG